MARPLQWVIVDKPTESSIKLARTMISSVDAYMTALGMPRIRKMWFDGESYYDLVFSENLNRIMVWGAAKKKLVFYYATGGKLYGLAKTGGSWERYEIVNGASWARIFPDSYAQHSSVGTVIRRNSYYSTLFRARATPYVPKYARQKCEDVDYISPPYTSYSPELRIGEGQVLDSPTAPQRQYSRWGELILGGWPAGSEGEYGLLSSVLNGLEVLMKYPNGTVYGAAEFHGVLVGEGISYALHGVGKDGARIYLKLRELTGNVEVLAEDDVFAQQYIEVDISGMPEHLGYQIREISPDSTKLLLMTYDLDDDSNYFPHKGHKLYKIDVDLATLSATQSFLCDCYTESIYQPNPRSWQNGSLSKEWKAYTFNSDSTIRAMSISITGSAWGEENRTDNTEDGTRTIVQSGSGGISGEVVIDIPGITTTIPLTASANFSQTAVLEAGEVDWSVASSGTGSVTNLGATMYSDAFPQDYYYTIPYDPGDPDNGIPETPEQTIIAPHAAGYIKVHDSGNMGAVYTTRLVDVEDTFESISLFSPYGIWSTGTATIKSETIIGLPSGLMDTGAATDVVIEGTSIENVCRSGLSILNQMNVWFFSNGISSRRLFRSSEGDTLFFSPVNQEEVKDYYTDPLAYFGIAKSDGTLYDLTALGIGHVESAGICEGITPTQAELIKG